MSFTQHHCQSLTYTKSSASTGFSVIVTPPDTRIRLKFKMEIFLIIDSPKIFLLIKKNFRPDLPSRSILQKTYTTTQ